jgi:S1-C subfamily serine protease
LGAHIFSNVSTITRTARAFTLVVGSMGGLSTSDPSGANTSGSALLGILDDVPDQSDFQAGLDTNRGRKILMVQPNSTASQLGLKQGDVIVNINGIPVLNGRSMRNELS